MNFKDISEFFKPNLMKLIIFVIVFFLIPIPIAAVRGCFGGTSEVAVCTYWVIQPFAGIYLLTGFFRMLIMPPSPSQAYFSNVPDIYLYQIPIITIIFLLISYIVASVIVWYYERLR